MPVPRGKAHNVARVCIFAAAFLGLQLCILHGGASADLLSGFAEVDYTHANNKVKDVGGNVTSDMKADTFTHRYNVNLNLNPYPLLRFTAGTLFQQDFSTVSDIGTNGSSSDTTLFPFADLYLNGPLYNLGTGYSRREVTSKSGGVSSPTDINEEYHANLLWKPEGFPEFAARVTRSNTFDAQRAFRDLTDNTLLTSLRYSPVKPLDLRYQLFYDDSTDRINNLKNTSLTHSGIANYSDHFFNQRVTVYSNYTLTRRETTTEAGGGGTIDSPLFPTAAFSAFNNDPTLGTPEQNAPNPALIDSNLTVSAGINLGLQPLGTDPSLEWSMGLDFFNDTIVNTFFVFVDRDITAFANLFTWHIYIRERDTDVWTEVTPASGIKAAEFQSVPGQGNKFVIRFAGIPSTRFVKLVVAPLTQFQASTLPPSQNPTLPINVTELQPFINRPAAQLQGTTATTSHTFAGDVRTRILDTPSLYHSLNFFLTATDPGQTTYTLANILALDHKISSILSGGASIERDDSLLSSGHDTTYTYTASLRANPLSGMSNTLIYSGRSEHSTQGASSSDSVFLNNTFQIYKGVGLNLNAGGSLATDPTGRRNETVQFTVGANVVPRRDVNIVVSYHQSSLNGSGGNLPPSSATSKNGDFSISYRPFLSLYLATAFGMTAAENTKNVYTQNYSANWSPFSEGNLLFNFAYTQNFSTLNNQKTTLISPSISWKIMPRANLDVSYPVIITDSATGSSEQVVFSMVLRVTL